jgi:hypothetical protein
MTRTRRTRDQLEYTVEAEAFEPEDLREIVREAILDQADVEALGRAWKVEELERESLTLLAQRGLPFKLDSGSGVER